MSSNNFVRKVKRSGDLDTCSFGGKLAKKLYESSLEGRTTDVELIFGKFNTEAPKIHVHSAVLTTASRVFNVWMTDCWNSEFIKTDDGKTLISLPEDNVGDFRMFVKLMYGYQNIDPEEDCYDAAIPAFRIADKYEAEDVLAFCNTYFESLIRNFEHVNVPKLMLLAQEYHLDYIFDAGLQYVKTHPLLIMNKNPLDWAKLDGDFLIKILSTDNLRVPEVLENSWSWNERILCRIALKWLHNKQIVARDETNDEGTESEPDEASPPKRSRMELQIATIATRVLQNIRFKQMRTKDFRKCIHSLARFLSREQIGTIYLVWSGLPTSSMPPNNGDREPFIVDTRKRQTDPNLQIVEVESSS